MIHSGLSSKIYDWLDRRLDLQTYQALAQKKVVPVHGQSVWYYMGGIVLILMILQLLTGLLLMIYYIPDIRAANSSILLINSQIDFGWFVRSLHSWGANLAVLMVFIHFFSTYFMKAYRTPREITWLSGLILMGLVFAFGFTGYLLPWDEVSFFATKIGIDIASKTPFIGEALAELLRGGSVIAQNTLSRFFSIHVMLLPLLLAPVLGLHLWLVQIQGMSEPEAFQKQPAENREYEKFFPTFILKDTLAWILVINFLAVVVAIFPWGVGQQADPFAPAPMGIKPEWYFLAMFQFLKLLPGHIGPFEGEVFGIVLFDLVAAGFVLMPFFDTGQFSRRSQIATGYGWTILVLFIIFTIWGAVS